ncbi:unnamed protein product, partial [marine sediment metagenome]
SASYFEKWNLFIENSRNGTFLNSKRFLNYHPSEQFNDSSLLFFKKSSIIAVIPAAIITENDGKIFFSHPGSTYGGIIIGNKTRINDINEILKLILEYCKIKKINQIKIKTPPKIYHRYPSDEVDFCLHYNGFNVRARDLSTCIKLDKLDRSLMIKNTIVATNQGKKKGVLVEKSEDFETVWKILIKNLKKHETTPTHTLEEIKLLKSLFPEKIQLFVAKIDNKIIGASILFVKNKQAIHTQYLALDYDFEKTRALNVIIDFLINYGIDNGFTYLNIGVSTEGFGQKINWGLFRFKEGFGGRGIIHDLWEKQL